MDQIVQTLGMIGTLTEHITDEELDHMLRTCALGECVGFIFVQPLKHGEAMDNLARQRRWIETIKAVRQTNIETGIEEARKAA